MKDWMGIGFALVLVNSSASASSLNIHISGVVDSMWSVGLPMPSGAISLGDPFQVDLTYDPSTYALGNSAMRYAIHMPHYLRGGSDNIDAVVANDHSFCGGCVVFDSFALSSSPVEVGGAPRPFDLGPGLYLEHFDLDLYDYSATALGSDQVPLPFPLAAFPVSSINFLFYEPYEGREVFVRGDGLSITQTSSVLEPDTWLLGILGLAAAGTVLRAGRATRKTPRQGHGV
jgi:hypothetical protein